MKFIKLIFLLVVLFIACSEERFHLEETEIAIMQADFEDALYTDETGYPKIDWEKFDRNNFSVIEKNYKAIILENRYLTLTLLPEIGRIYSLVFKATGSEELWQADVARPIGGLNDLGWWFVIGGIEYVIPRGEHGTTFALPWSYSIEENSETVKRIKMTVTEPGLKLQENLFISVFPDKAYFKTDIEVFNKNTRDVKFSHWINPMWCPGGRGEITNNTEFIIPSDSVIVADKSFNKWMFDYGTKIQAYRDNPMRYILNWKDKGDILVKELNYGFYSAYSHDEEEGIVRVFDKDITPGVDVWTWGFDPPERDWRVYSQEQNKGYVEIWGGITMDYHDSSLVAIKQGGKLSWTEYMYPFHNLKGLKYANEKVAVNLTLEPEKNRLFIGIYSTEKYENTAIQVFKNEEILVDEVSTIKPENPVLIEKNLDKIEEIDYIRLIIIYDGITIVDFSDSVINLITL